jgi:hypothetical protein
MRLRSDRAEYHGIDRMEGLEIGFACLASRSCLAARVRETGIACQASALDPRRSPAGDRFRLPGERARSSPLAFGDVR